MKFPTITILCTLVVGVFCEISQKNKSLSNTTQVLDHQTTKENINPSSNGLDLLESFSNSNVSQGFQNVTKESPVVPAVALPVGTVIETPPQQVTTWQGNQGIIPGVVAKVERKPNPMLVLLGSKTFQDILSPKIMAQKDASDQLIPPLLNPNMRSQLNAMAPVQQQQSNIPQQVGYNAYPGQTIAGRVFTGPEVNQGYGSMMGGASQPLYYPVQAQQPLQG